MVVKAAQSQVSKEDYRLTDLKPVHVVFDANDLTALGKRASDDQWFSAFSRKLDQELAKEA